MEALMEILERETPESVVIPAVVTPTPVEEPDPFEEEVLTVADRAREVFGYTELSGNIRAKRQKKDEEREAGNRRRAEERQIAILRAKAREVLAELGIVPYSKESVEKYKAAVVDEAEEAYYINHATRVVSAWLIPIFIVAAITFGIVAANYKAVTIWDHIALYNICAAGGSIILFHILELIRAKRPGRWYNDRHRRGEVFDAATEYTWAEESLRGYSDEIPSFALDIALRVHEYLPNADLHVEVLRKKPVREPEDEDSSPSYDLLGSTSPWDGEPFLVLEVAGERHYIAVWGEPGFERENHP